ncbi:MAG: hydroxymethylglutaryl-CoA reductase, degradative [Lentilactobacillus diolivorans]|nr:hydroxymethylglutaryl-CoA reductase, degradative [Lentilactobacillus diolivorans]RRG01643.1 MAG: hydroxymethylglutaryl-CoA reductase, degradative [Lactobacillus sp.]
MNQQWDHFYKKTYQERLQLIVANAKLDAAQFQKLQAGASGVSTNLIENYLTDYALPEGIVTNLVVNDQPYLVPMVTEEPSVIAAASNGSKLLADGKGISGAVLDRVVTGQVVIKTSQFEKVNLFIQQHQAEAIEVANKSHQRILQYSRGARELAVRQLDSSFVSVDLTVDTGEAMGANLINTMLEAVANWLREQLHVEITMAILSNFADGSLVRVSGCVNSDKLATQTMTGRQVAQRIVDASRVAQIDIRRAATHNKGIMNGIDAAVIALGNDSRAVESAVHSFAARDGSYRGVSQWRIDHDRLVGEMTVPMPIGFLGGATKVLPLVSVNQAIMGVKNVHEEMMVIAAVGLAQNLAALKALVTDGIQRGHMNLQLKSLAMANGTTEAELPQILPQLRQLKQPDSLAVKRLLNQLRK